MASTYKVLGQLAPTGTTEATLATVGAAKSWVISSLVIANLTSSAANATVSVCVAGAATSNANTLLKTVSIPALTTVGFSLGITMAATDLIRVTSGTANALSFQIFGSEIS